MLDILIIMNNYFHDVATATLIAAAADHVDARASGASWRPEDLATLIRAYPTLSRFANGALIWVILGGIPRVITFNTHDLGAIRGDLIPAIAVKHVVEVAAVVLGVLLWRRVRNRIQAAGGQTSE